MGEWVDREIWTERMLAALVTASKDGKESKWFSLIDKVWRDSTLGSAWKQVRTRRGAAGIDRVSIARFEAQAPKYLGEIAEQLKTGQYRAQAVRRVEIPKAGGGSRALGIPRRLRALLRKREKRPGAGRCQADTRRWPNAYFAALGLFTMSTARFAASRPR